MLPGKRGGCQNLACFGGSARRGWFTIKLSLVLEPEGRQKRKKKKSELIAIFCHVQGKLLMKRPEV